MNGKAAHHGRPLFIREPPGLGLKACALEVRRSPVPPGPRPGDLGAGLASRRASSSPAT